MYLYRIKQTMSFKRNVSSVYDSIVLYWIVLFLIFISNFPLYGQNYILPEPSGKVISDYQSLLSDVETEEIAREIIRPQYEANSNQLIVVSIPTRYMGDLAIEEYANKLFKAWRPGQKDLNNGVLFLIVGSATDTVNRKVRIEVGYGLEGALPDILTSRILRDIVVPRLKKHEFAGAIKYGSRAIISAINSENKGKRPLYKIRTDDYRQAKLSDEVGLLSASDFNNLSELLNGFSESYEPSLIMEGVISENQVSYLNRAFSWSSNRLITLMVNTTIEIDPDYRVSRKPETYYALEMNNAQNFSDKEKEVRLTRVLTLLNRNDPVAAIKEALIIKKESIRKGWWRLASVTLLEAVPIIIVLLLWFRRDKQFSLNKKKLSPAFYVFLVTLSVIAFLILVLHFIFTVSLFAYTFDLPAWPLFGVFVFTEGILLLGAIWSVKLFRYYQPESKRKRYVGSSSDSSYDSSYSSGASSYSSSSDSDYGGSSSNSDYGGGGGDSGGGGSSSDW